MLKSKVILICLILPVLAAIGVVSFGIFKGAENHQTFSDSGYILVSPGSAYSDTINESVYFTEGSKFKNQYQNLVVFKNQENNKVTVNAKSFVHYNDKSIGAMSDGVLIDLNELDGSVMNHYGLSASSIMERSGNGYILDNMGDSLKFQDFIWKISDTKYLLASEEIRIGLSDSRILEFEDYVELTYYDTGIVRIVTQEGTWQTVSANSAAKLANGVLINLANRTIVGNNGMVRLSLEQMVIDSDDNIKILPDEVRKKDPKVPEFDIKTIDGISGKAGEPGEAGEHGEKGLNGLEGIAGKEGKAGAAGLPGNPGEPGTTGVTGANGANGSSGGSGANGAAGANGANGGDGTPPEEPGGPQSTLLPSFEMTSMEVKSNSVLGSILVSDEERRIDLSKQFLLQVLENDTGRQVYSSTYDSSAMDFQYKIDKLVPNKQYCITLTADYVVDNVNYTRVFLNKLFTTDSLGLEVRKEYSTNSSIGLNIRKKDYSDIASADLQLTDKDGNEVKTKVLDLTAASSEDGVNIEFDGLESNKLYHVKFLRIKLEYDPLLEVPNEERPEDYWTLKKAPVLGKPVVIINKRNSSFDMQIEGVVDTDLAIITYRYEIYEIGYNPGEGEEVLAKVLYTTKKDILSCYIDGVKVQNQRNYRLKVIAECYDNEKKVEYASPLSDVFSMEGNKFPLVLFETDKIFHERIEGIVSINTNGCILTINAQNPLIVSYQSSTGDVRNFTYNQLSQYLLVSNDNTLYTIQFNAGDLLADDNYILSVHGTIDLNDGAGPRKSSHIGSVVVKTERPSGFRAVLTQENSQTHPIAFRLGLVDSDLEDSSEYEASTISSIEVNIYNGDEDQISRQSLKATCRLSGENGSEYSSTLKEQLYGDGKSILITEEDFHINPSVITSSKYTVEVVSVRDYTRYANDFEVQSNIKTFTKSATLPDLEDINVNDGLIIKPITLANIADYVEDGELEKYTGFDTGIIFGYDVRAAYFDNSTELVESFEYNVFEQKYYDELTISTAADLYDRQPPVEIVKVIKPVETDGIVPGEVFLFGQTGKPGEEMSRGSKFVFTYRAVLKEKAEGGVIRYFPDCVDEKVIIRSTTREAPYQVPRFNLYPWVSDAGSMIWKYNIHAPDVHALYGGFQKTGPGSLEFKNDQNQLKEDEIRVNDLEDRDAYTLWQNVTRFKLPYNEITRVNLASQYFETVRTMTTAGTTLSYSIVDEPQFNRYRIVITDNNDDIKDLSRVVALKVKVFLDEQAAKEYDSGADDAEKPAAQITVPLPNIPGKAASGSLPYTSLEQYVGSTLYFRVDAVYDSGISGFMDADGQDRAIQTMPGLLIGNYINLNFNGDGLVEDITSYAKGSYFHFDSFEDKTVSLELTYDSLINDEYINRPMKITCDQTGARLDDIGTRPRITLKSVDAVQLKITGSDETVSSFDLKAFTPVVTLNRGAAYTIVTTINSATVSWILNGHAAQIDQGEMPEGVMYFELFTIDPMGRRTPTGRLIETDIDRNVNGYTTPISGLAQNTKYGIQIFYINKQGDRVYPIDSYLPDDDPSTRIFTFTTNDKIVITPGSPAFSYYAGAYTNKYLQLSYSLNQTLGFNIEYSICKKSGDTYTEVMKSSALTQAGIISTPTVYSEQMNNERFMMRPGSLCWEEEGIPKVYFPFDSSEYYLCMKPVSKSDSTVVLGDPAYVLLNVPSLRQPFYNIRTVPGEGKVTFQISVLDSDRVMVGGHYKVKIIDGDGTDITPAGCRNTQYYIGNPVNIEVNNLQQEDKAILQIYSVYDMNNSGLYQDGSVMTDITDVTYEALDDTTRGYMKVSTEGHPLNTLGYDLGKVQIAQSSERLAAIYFTDAVNLDMVIKYIQYVVIVPEGSSYSYSEPFSPVTIDEEDRRYYYELGHRFDATGIYQIQVRFMDENMRKLEDRVLTLIKNV